MSLKIFLKLAAAALALILGACNFPARPAVSTPDVPQAGTPLPTQAGPVGNATPTQGSTGAVVRPTTEPVAPLAGVFPDLQGFYWNKNLLVEDAGSGVEITAGMPCSELVDLLGASEWRLAGQAQPPFTGVMFPALAQFEWGARRALLRAQDLGVGVDLLALQSGDLSQAVPTPGPDDLVGCSAVLEPLTEQRVQFTGDFQEQGQTWAYPLPLGCMEVGDTISVNMMYEGPGALLTKLTFSVPKRTGEHALEGDNLSLEVIRGNLKVIDFFSVGYAQPNMGDDDGRWIELYPYNEDAGTATVRSLEPLQGEVELVDWESDEGELISLSAGFQCDVTGAGR